MEAPLMGTMTEGMGSHGAGDGMDTTASRGNDRFTTHLRNMAARRVAATSLRSVSREIGMSATGLSKFLNGNAPYSPTLHRLRNWYLRHAAEDRTTQSLSEESAYAALALLVHDLSPDARHAAVENMVACMREGYAKTGDPVPGWLDGMREKFPAPVEPAPRRHRVPMEEDA
jgi:hypothetical protein